MDFHDFLDFLRFLPFGPKSGTEKVPAATPPPSTQADKVEKKNVTKAIPKDKTTGEPNQDDFKTVLDPQRTD